MTTPDGRSYKIQVHHVSLAELQDMVTAWKDDHPGFDESNYWEFWRDADGVVQDHEDDFADAASLFTRWNTARKVAE